MDADAVTQSDAIGDTSAGADNVADGLLPVVGRKRVRQPRQPLAQQRVDLVCRQAVGQLLHCLGVRRTIMGSPSRNVQYHPPRLSEDRLNLPQPHSPSLPTHCSGKSGMRPFASEPTDTPERTESGCASATPSPTVAPDPTATPGPTLASTPTRASGWSRLPAPREAQLSTTEPAPTRVGD